MQQQHKKLASLTMPTDEPTGVPPPPPPSPVYSLRRADSVTDFDTLLTEAKNEPPHMTVAVFDKDLGTGFVRLECFRREKHSIAYEITNRSLYKLFPEAKSLHSIDIAPHGTFFFEPSPDRNGQFDQFLEQNEINPNVYKEVTGSRVVWAGEMGTTLLTFLCFGRSFHNDRRLRNHPQSHPCQNRIEKNLVPHH